jgi:hypothetical protein
MMDSDGMRQVARKRWGAALVGQIKISLTAFPRTGAAARPRPSRPVPSKTIFGSQTPIHVCRGGIWTMCAPSMPLIRSSAH